MQLGSEIAQSARLASSRAMNPLISCLRRLISRPVRALASIRPAVSPLESGGGDQFSTGIVQGKQIQTCELLSAIVAGARSSMNRFIMRERRAPPVATQVAPLPNNQANRQASQLANSSQCLAAL